MASPPSAAPNADSESPSTDPSTVVSPPGVPTEDPDLIASAKDLFDVRNDLAIDKLIDKDLEEELEKIMSRDANGFMNKPNESNEPMPCGAEFGKAESTPKAIPSETDPSRPNGEEDSFEQITP